MFKRLIGAALALCLMAGNIAATYAESTKLASFFGPSSFSGSFFKSGSIQLAIEAPSNFWLFSEGEGEAVTDEMGVTDLTVTGGTWGVGYLDIDADAVGGGGSDFWVADNATTRVANRFTVGFWGTLNTDVDGNTFPLTMSSGLSGFPSELDWYFRIGTDKVVRAVIVGSDGVTADQSDIITASNVYTGSGSNFMVGEKGLFVLSYESVAGGTSKAQLWYAEAGNLKEFSTTGLLTDSNLIDPDAAFRLRARLAGNNTGADMRWHQAFYLDDVFLTNAKVGNLFTLGSDYDWTAGLPALPTIVTEGDSLSAEPNANGYDSYPLQLQTLSPTAGWYVVEGENSDTAAGIKTDSAAKAVTYASGNTGAAQDKLILWAGRNDIRNGASAATTLVDLNLIVDDYSAQGYKVYVLTALPGADFTTAANDERILYNTAIKANVDSKWTVIDLEADPRLTDNNDLTYFHTDAVHLNTTGYGIVAGLVQTGAGLPLATAPTSDLMAAAPRLKLVKSIYQRPRPATVVPFATTRMASGF